MTASTHLRTDQMLREAVAAAQGGDLARARALAEQGLALAADADSVPFHAFLGMIEARDGNAALAMEHLRNAHRLRPGDITIACNLVSILSDNGLEDEALLVASPALLQADPSLRIARMRGFLAQQLERYAEAIEAYRIVLAREPDDFETLNNLGNAYAGLGEHDQAVALLRRALSVDPDAAPTYLNLASALLSVESFDDAEGVLADASARFVDDSRPPYQLYILHKTRFDQDAAIAALSTASQRAPDDADLQLKLGIEYGVVRDTVAAEQAYRRAIELDPRLRDAYLGLAIQYEHTNREDEFAKLIALARRNGLASEDIAFIEALELRRIKDFRAAMNKLDLVPATTEPIRTAHVRATLLDRLGDTDEAFAAFEAANMLMQDTPTEPLERARELRETLRGELGSMTGEWRSGWTDVQVQDDRADPVFLVGFPRSGTTLLDTLLMGHPDTTVMEEQPPLNRVEDMLGGGIESLPGLGDSAISEARDRYFAEVAQVADWNGDTLLIDKSPLFLYRLPLIQRLFPRAKIILALRHPCDVILSCFMSNFRLNPAMANFLRLDDAACFYDLCFNHWSRANQLFSAEVHTVRYEQLVENVEETVRPLVDWLGLEWAPNLLDHTVTAKSRGLITTASYSQVTEPIYRRALGRWQRYRKHLEPVLPILDAWIERLGYGPN